MTFIRPEALSHLCFSTSDLTAMEDWYARLFGWAPHTRFRTSRELTGTRTKGQRERATVLIGELGGRALEIGQYEPLEPVQTGLTHFGVRVRDVDQAYRHAVRMGATIAVEPFDPIPGLRVFFVSDPDGNQIEIGNLPDLTRPMP